MYLYHLPDDSKKVGTLSSIKYNGQIITSHPQNVGKLINGGWNKSEGGWKQSQKLIIEGTIIRLLRVSQESSTELYLIFLKIEHCLLISHFNTIFIRKLNFWLSLNILKKHYYIGP